MNKSLVVLLALLSLSATAAFGQGLETTAQKDDWEEINFEFDSSILTDGYPSLLRLADLLAKSQFFVFKIVAEQILSSLALFRSQFREQFGPSCGLDLNNGHVGFRIGTNEFRLALTAV